MGSSPEGLVTCPGPRGDVSEPRSDMLWATSMWRVLPTLRSWCSSTCSQDVQGDPRDDLVWEQPSCPLLPGCGPTGCKGRGHCAHPGSREVGWVIGGDLLPFKGYVTLVFSCLWAINERAILKIIINRLYFFRAVSHLQQN